jgi:hypothetical protein
MKSFANRLAAGIRRHPLAWIVAAFLAYSALWTILDSVGSFFPPIGPKGVAAYLSLVVVSIAIGLWRSLPPTGVRFRIPTTNTILQIEFGDLFAAPGLRVVSVNEFFDSDLGDHVSPRSLHGQLLTRAFGGHPQSFDALVEQSLEGRPFEHVSRRSGRTRRYPLGTTAVIPVNNGRYLLPAVCKTDQSTLKASATVPELWIALEGLWGEARLAAGGDVVSLPLLGGGLAGIGLPPAQHLQLLILSVVSATKHQHITNEIRIILSPSCLDEIDLAPIQREWS